MHTSGKVMAWLVVLGCGFAMYLSAKALSIRTAWMQAAQKSETEFIEAEQRLAEKTRILADKRSAYARDMLGWDRYWPDAGGAVGATANADGTLTLNIGTNHGVQQNQVLFVFKLNADGTSAYLGDFRVIRGNEANCQVRPNWRTREGELLTEGGSAVRVRTLIPNQYQARFAGLDQQLLDAEQSVASNQTELARQAMLSEQSDKLIASRLGELNGDPQLQGKLLPPVNLKGLLTSISEEEEARNAALSEADALRRELKKVRDAYERIRAVNQQLTDSLPRAGQVEPAVGAAGR